MSATRLLILGAVRIFQPVHGYLVRRELLTWRIESWANVHPGSIYNGLRSLTKEGYLEELATESQGSRPARTTYRLTADGENEYQGLLSAGLWRVDTKDPTLLMTALSFFVSLSREQAAEAFEARETALRLELKALAAATRQMASTQTVPAHVFEGFDLGRHRLEGELAYVVDARRRVASGYYRFADEPGSTEGPTDGRWPGPLDRPVDIS